MGMQGIFLSWVYHNRWEKNTALPIVGYVPIGSLFALFGSQLCPYIEKTSGINNVGGCVPIKMGLGAPGWLCWQRIQLLISGL